MQPLSTHPRRDVLVFTLAATALLASGCAAGGGATTATVGASPRGRLVGDDFMFAMQAADGGLYEVEAGRLATTRATRPEVQRFGQMLVDHHTAANAELIELLQARAVRPPAAMPSQMSYRLARLAAADAREFDSQFVRTVGVDEHRQQVGLFERASREVQDPALRAWFVKTLPALRSHLNAAQTLAGSLAG
jgi:putative membrane protein